MCYNKSTKTKKEKGKNMNYYVLTDGKRFLTKYSGCDKFVPCDSVVTATQFTTILEAEKTLKNHIKKSDAELFYVRGVLIYDENPIEIKKESSTSVENNVAQSVITENPTLLKVSLTIDEEMQKLSKSLSDVDLKVSDILHYFEQDRIPAHKLSSLTKILREQRKVRREIKERMTRLQRGKNALVQAFAAGYDDAASYRCRTGVLSVFGYDVNDKFDKKGDNV